MEKKICKKCGVEKLLCEFDNRKSSKDGLSCRCKECRRNYFNQYNSVNAEKKRESQKKRYWENREKELERINKKHQKNKEKEIQYRKDNRHKINERERNRYNSDILYRLRVNMRNRLKLFLKSKKIYKTNTTLSLVGGTPEIIKEYIEKQFTDGMSWDNYGYYGWHIDHIIPLSSAETEEGVHKLCHYTNLQPLWSDDNYKKGDKII
tara:strand:- start:2132 stop:2752 length:621 start_codon:yes stop_codon:yes gene_type:complete